MVKIFHILGESDQSANNSPLKRQATNKGSVVSGLMKKQTMKNALLRKVSLLHSNNLQAKY